MSIKGNIVRFVESALNVRVVRPHYVTRLFEEMHLKRLLSTFNVDCVFDIGANIGQYGEMLRTRAGYRGDIISYEPNPGAASLLRQNTQVDPKWHVVEIGLDRTPGQRPFNIMASDQCSSFLTPSENETRLVAHWNKIEQRITVETQTLAHEFADWSGRLQFRCPFLKMDTQGNDTAIVQGGEGVIRHFIGIQTELAIKRSYEGAHNFDDAIQYLRSLGFELSALVPNNEGFFPQLIEIDAILIRNDLMA